VSFPDTLPTSRVPSALDAPQLRWGILGTGWIANVFAQSVRKYTRQTFAAVGSRSLDRAQELARRIGAEGAVGSYEELVDRDDVDVVYVATVHNQHHPGVKLALEAGKHVLVEKPFALNQSQAEDMVATARKNDRFLTEALWTFYLPKFDVIRQLLEAGTLGEIRSIYTDQAEYLPQDHRIHDPALAGGPLLDLGTYPVALITELLGVPARVLAVGQDDPTGVTGQLAAVLVAENGSLATMGTSMYGTSPTNAAIVGTEATISFDNWFYFPGPFRVFTKDQSRTLIHDEPAVRHLGGLFYQAAEVARCIADGRTETPIRPLASSLETMRTLDMIRRECGIDFSAAGLIE
jgi:predicted dehydrogenase